METNNFSLVNTSIKAYILLDDDGGYIIYSEGKSGVMVKAETETVAIDKFKKAFEMDNAIDNLNTYNNAVKAEYLEKQRFAKSLKHLRDDKSFQLIRKSIAA